MIAAVFIGFLLFFVVIGLAASWRSSGGTEDYFMAGRTVPPWLTALSAASTSNSGFMFIGLIGYTYALGLPVLWMQIGFFVGDYMMSRRVYPGLRVCAGEKKSVSYAGVLAHWHGDEIRIIRLAVALISLIFLALYAAAQFRAGSKAMTVLFEWPDTAGVILGAMIVFAYCLFGGMRASIWTDAAQSFVMMFSMALMVIVALIAIGGPAELMAALPESHQLLFPPDMMLGPMLGPLLFLFGWIAGGIGFIGQPHIMARFMAMRSADEISRVRIYYYTWNATFSLLALMAGLTARVLLPEVDNFDAELAMPQMALQLLPLLLVGVVLSGIFAASVSTADSQIISCSTVLAHDLMPQGQRNSILYARLGTCIITGAAFLIALYGPGSVFSLVLIAWAGMGACFGPILLVRVYGGALTGGVAIAMMISGLAGILIWRQFAIYNEIYELLPGLLAGLATYWIWRYFWHGRVPAGEKSPLATSP